MAAWPTSDGLVLPVYHPGYWKAPRALAKQVLLKLGFTVGAPHERKRFRHVTLPQGWIATRTTIKGMVIKDEKGRSRIVALSLPKSGWMIYFMGAIRLSYIASPPNLWFIVTHPSQGVLYRSEPIALDDANKRIKSESELYAFPEFQVARDWIKNHYPDFMDPTAYWD